MNKGEWVAIGLFSLLMCVGAYGAIVQAPWMVGSPAAIEVAATDTLSEATLQRWLAWMDDDRVPVFWFWRDPSTGKWVAICHIVKRTWSPHYKAWYEDAWSLENALVKVLDKLDADLELRY